jgi:hypothetical protein
MTSTITLPARFCGPPDSANGGYTAGALARYVDGPAEVTLRCPPPLDRPLIVVVEGERVLLRDGDQVVAEAIPATLDLDLPHAVAYDVAVEASLGSPFRDTTIHPFPGCFACGPNRHEGDGLRLFAGRVPGTDVFAAPWTPVDVDDEIVWAALDCPSAFVMYLEPELDGTYVLGRFAVHIDAPVRVGDPYEAVAWRVGVEGRKLFAGSALFAADGPPVAYARAVWVRLA